MKRALAVVAVAAVAAIAAVVTVARRHASDPHRCGAGFVAVGARCCGEGQSLARGRCVGMPTACGPDHAVTSTGCAPRHARIAFAGGSVTIGPSDWEAQGVVEPRTITVGPFALDRFEIDRARYGACVRAHACPEISIDDDPFAARGGEADVFRAAVLTDGEARALCASVGGRLPTDDEWTFAAMGAAARRYPWGDTGAVCDRAVFGLARGPCASDGDVPDTVGARPRGATPEGVLDLAGNVAEWTTSSRGPRARGGSFATSLATELRGWSADGAPSPRTVGARCAY